MVDLMAAGPAQGILPLDVAGFSIRAADVGHLTHVAPFAGQAAALDGALRAAHGLGWPAPNRSLDAAPGRIIWFGREAAMLIGPAPGAALADHAALADQSDAWAAIEVQGAGIEDVLARLVPVDTRPASFDQGHTLRSQIQHMNGSITRLGPDRVLFLVFRSMAATLVHDLQEAILGLG